MREVLLVIHPEHVWSENARLTYDENNMLQFITIYKDGCDNYKAIDDIFACAWCERLYIFENKKVQKIWHNLGLHIIGESAELKTFQIIHTPKYY